MYVHMCVWDVRYDAVRGAGHGEGGEHRAHEPDGAADAAHVPRPARGVRGAAHLPVRPRRAAHGSAASRSVATIHSLDLGSWSRIALFAILPFSSYKLIENQISLINIFFMTEF